MKTILDLPDDLVNEVASRAARQGRKPEELVADLLRKGLKGPVATMSAETFERPRIMTDSETGLPVIVCSHPASDAEELAPGRVADLLVEQEAAWSRESAR